MDDNHSGQYELDEITIRKAENGYVVRCSKKLTKEAREAQERTERKSKGGTSPSLEYYQYEEYVAETKDSALLRVRSELDEYTQKKSKKADSDDAGNFQAGGLGFR